MLVEANWGVGPLIEGEGNGVDGRDKGELIFTFFMMGSIAYFLVLN